MKSHTLSVLLGVSDSYLKKILRRMVKVGVLVSSASKDGGFLLTRSIEDITLYDVCHAIEGDGKLEISGLDWTLFVDDEKLKSLKMSSLLIEKNYKEGWAYFEDCVK